MNILLNLKFLFHQFHFQIIKPKNGNLVSIPTPISDDNPVGSISLGGDRKIDLFLKNDPKVRPAFHQLVEDDKRAEHCTTVQTTLIEFVENNPGNPGSILYYKPAKQQKKLFLLVI